MEAAVSAPAGEADEAGTSAAGAPIVHCMPLYFDDVTTLDVDRSVEEVFAGGDSEKDRARARQTLVDIFIAVNRFRRAEMAAATRGPTLLHNFFFVQATRRQLSRHRIGGVLAFRYADMSDKGGELAPGTISPAELTTWMTTHYRRDMARWETYVIVVELADVRGAAIPQELRELIDGRVVGYDDMEAGTREMLDRFFDGIDQSPTHLVFVCSDPLFVRREPRVAIRVVPAVGAAADKYCLSGKCHSCGTTGALKRCVCRRANYCSRACQKADWKTHKPHCADASA